MPARNLSCSKGLTCHIEIKSKVIENDIKIKLSRARPYPTQNMKA